MTIKRFVLYTLLLLSIASCQTDSLFEDFSDDNSTKDNLLHDYPANDGVRCALEKARLVAGIEWTPITNIPSVYSNPYLSGITRKGLPYSLAQVVNGYVGLDVSFYTFLTAIHNPYSVMYTENLRKKPYNSFDCAPYYGSVCATSVWYALGIKAPYYTSSINAIPDLKRSENLGPDSIKLCDVLWKKGHVAMVYDIARNMDSKICKVSIFETTTSNHADSRIIRYTYEEFTNMWNNYKWVIYRPRNLSNNTFNDSKNFDVSATNIVPLFFYNNDICTSRGDQVAYAAGDDVVINILSNRYKEIELYRDENLYETRAIKENNITFTNLPYGLYKARLVNNKLSSDFTYFEIIDINISYNVTDKVTIFFSSKNSSPEFLSFGDERQCPYYCTIFSQKQIENGYVTVSKSEPFLKVHFRGKYGRVSNKTVKIY